MPAEKITKQKKVAVVNMDEGVKYDAKVVNYWTILLASIPIEHVVTGLEEFHSTQDAAGTILENDKKDSAVLADVGGYDLREFIKLPELKMVENSTKPLNLQTQYEINDGLLDGIDHSYKTPLTENQTELDYMKGQNQTSMKKSGVLKSSLQTAKEEADQTVVTKYDDTKRAKAEDEVY